MSKTKTIYLCPLTNTRCDGCGGDSDCGLTRKPKEVPVRMNPDLSYELSTERFKARRKIRDRILMFSFLVLYAAAVYCVYATVRVIAWLL